MKKITLLLFAILLSVASAFAQSGQCGDNLYWTYSASTLTITGTGDMYDYQLDAGNSNSTAPWGTAYIAFVSFPEGMTSVGSYAFYHRNLTSPTFPGSLTTIKESAFYSCLYITSLTIPNSVSTIESRAFYGCSNLKTLNFNATNCAVGSNWFSKAYLTTLNIGANVETIPDNAFSECSGLTSVTIPNSVITIGKGAFLGCGGLSSITIPNSVTTIKSIAFNSSGLISIEIPNSITIIEESTFGYCQNLTSVTIPNSITTIGEFAFNNCESLTSITIPNSVKTIQWGAFSRSGLISVIIPNSVSKIESNTFSYCMNLTSIVIGNSVTAIGNDAFSNCKSLASITIPNSVKKIEANVFKESGLVSITIPASITKIEDGVFAQCSSLTSVVMPNSIISIGSDAFNNCNNIVSITIQAITPPSCASNAFYNVPKNISVYIPCLTYFDYHNDIVWSTFNLVINGTPTTPIPVVHNYSAIKCYGVPYTDANFTTPINGPGVYYKTLSNSTGCDSIIVCLTLTVYPLQRLCMVSVDGNSHNQVVWEKQGDIASYNIYREGTQPNNYELKGNVDYASPNIWVDTESDAKTRSYRYKISGVDTCGSESMMSSSHKTMHLTINAGMNNSWNLIWTPYEGTYYYTYNIYRSSGENMGEMELIGTMPSGNTSFSDFSAPEGYVYYVVEIMLNETCEVGKSGSSIKSNIATNNPNVGIAVETGRATSVQVFPNPTDGELRVTSYELQVTGVEVFDIYGRNVGFKFPSNKLEGWQPQADGVVFNISHLQSGIYFVKITTENGIVMKKVVKE